MEDKEYRILQMKILAIALKTETLDLDGFIKHSPAGGNPEAQANIKKLASSLTAVKKAVSEVKRGQ